MVHSPETRAAVTSTHIPIVTALLKAGADVGLANVCQSNPIQAAKAKLHVLRSKCADYDAAVERDLLEVGATAGRRRRAAGLQLSARRSDWPLGCLVPQVIEMLMAYANNTRSSRALNLLELRQRLEGIATWEDKVDALESALDQLALAL